MLMWKKSDSSAIYKTVIPLIEDSMKALEKKMEVKIKKFMFVFLNHFCL